MTTTAILTSDLQARVLRAVADNAGPIGFDRYMELALYTPGLGYYARDGAVFGNLPSDAGGSDFATAPGITPFFGRALAQQLAEALEATGTREIWEFGAGTGALADQLLQALGDRVDRYTIVDLSATLSARQRARLAPHGAKVCWVSVLPEAMHGVVVGNEVLDAMPVKLLVRREGRWFERRVSAGPPEVLAWQDVPTPLRPPLAVAGNHDYLTEIHPAAEAFIRTLRERLVQGAAFFIDYGFPEREYYHAQRSMGTVMCHRAHRVDADPLEDVGQKDITAHVNFTGLAVAAQEMEAGHAGVDRSAYTGDPSGGPFELLGYTSQGRFLINCGLPALLENASMQDRVMAQKLIMEHEMGELFKVIGFCKGAPWDALGFARGDRTHTL